ncbi:MAG: FAD-dependent oxidoreductase, partial [Clostridia bacterium]|nr:FAD-dependent oxidoreductase [Clostridia bacterium]
DHSWEYIFYDRQLTDDMIDFTLKMKIRTPYYIDELAKIQGMDVERCAKLADDMVRIGIIEYCTDDNGVDRVQLPVFAPGSMESTIMEKRITDAYPETAPAFLNYIFDVQKLVGSAIPMGQAIMRVIPVEESIAHEGHRAHYEELSHWLDEAGDSIGIVPCECRKIRAMCDEGTADLEGEWCISMGKFAESCIRVGKARRITREECEKILKDAEKRGYVHQVNNIDGPYHSVFLCNCSWDTCMALKASWYTSTPNMVRSNYLATVDPKNCVACGSCVEVCPQNAVKLGQKICQKNPVEIPETPNPDEYLLYGKKYWKTDLLTERKNVVAETGTAPCKSACPAHIAVQGYLKMAANGKYRDALELIKKENPFPAVCGSICARFCEENCTRGIVDAPVAIDEIKKYVADLEIHSDNRFIPEKINDKGEKIAIIGSGPAGLSCAYYLAVLGHDVTVFEKSEKPGGMMTYGMPSFRLDKRTVDAEIDVIRALGVDIKCGVEVGKDVTIQSLRDEGYKGFYIAIGAQGGRAVGVPGEDAEGVWSGIDFLRKAESDRKPALGEENVVVVGGGNVAVDVARTAARLTKGAVTMVCLEQRDEMPAAKDEVAEALEDGIELMNGWGPMKVLSENGRVTAVVFKKCTA